MAFKYVIIRNGEVNGVRTYKRELAPSEIKHQNGLPMARPLNINPKPPFDPMTQGLKKRFEVSDFSVDLFYDVVPLSDHRKIQALKEKLERLESTIFRQIVFRLGNLSKAQLPQVIQDKLTERDNIRAQIQALGG
jgi:hypothetical protein